VDSDFLHFLLSCFPHSSIRLPPSLPIFLMNEGPRLCPAIAGSMAQRGQRRKAGTDSLAEPLNPCGGDLACRLIIEGRAKKTRQRMEDWTIAGWLLL